MPRPLPTQDWFSKAIRKLSDVAGATTANQIAGKEAPRFVEKSTSNAIFLKTARYVSGLNAGRVLLRNGFLQELCVIQRTLDEIHEDVLYLSLPLLSEDTTPSHAEYLMSFWEEEPSYKVFSGHQKNRPTVRRKKVRAYLAGATAADAIDHTGIATSAYLSRLYSGYVHAAGPQLMELFEPSNKSFEVSGISSPDLKGDHGTDFEKQVYRGVITVFFCARVLGETQVFDEAAGIERRLASFFAD